MRAAFFDLDGTLLTINSAASWVRRERRLGRLTQHQSLRAMLFFTAYHFGAVDIEQAVRAALASIRGTKESVLRQLMHAWYRDEIAAHAAPGAWPVLENHRRRGDLTVLVTTSSLYAAEMARHQFGLDEVLCTRFEVQDGCFTGESLRPFCFGSGKVVLAEDLAERRDIDFSASTFYTDSFTDLPLLERVGAPRVVNPDPRLRLSAWRRGWPVLDWRR